MDITLLHATMWYYGLNKTAALKTIRTMDNKRKTIIKICFLDQARKSFYYD